MTNNCIQLFKRARQDAYAFYPQETGGRGFHSHWRAA
jgi:hypothetical protein